MSTRSPEDVGQAEQLIVVRDYAYRSLPNASQKQPRTVADISVGSYGPQNDRRPQEDILPAKSTALVQPLSHETSLNKPDSHEVPGTLKPDATNPSADAYVRTAHRPHSSTVSTVQIRATASAPAAPVHSYSQPTIHCPLPRNSFRRLPAEAYDVVPQPPSLSSAHTPSKSMQHAPSHTSERISSGIESATVSSPSFKEVAAAAEGLPANTSSPRLQNEVQDDTEGDTDDDQDESSVPSSPDAPNFPEQLPPSPLPIVVSASPTTSISSQEDPNRRDQFKQMQFPTGLQSEDNRSLIDFSPSVSPEPLDRGLLSGKKRQPHVANTVPQSTAKFGTTFSSLDVKRDKSRPTALDMSHRSVSDTDTLPLKKALGNPRLESLKSNLHEDLDDSLGRPKSTPAKTDGGSSLKSPPMLRKPLLERDLETRNSCRASSQAPIQLSAMDLLPDEVEERVQAMTLDFPLSPSDAQILMRILNDVVGFSRAPCDREHIQELRNRCLAVVMAPVPLANNPDPSPPIHRTDSGFSTFQQPHFILPLHGPDARCLINIIDFALEAPRPDFSHYTRLLRRLCGRSGFLPSKSHVILPNADLQTEENIGIGTFADVWRGTLGGRKAAIKALRVTLTNAQEVAKKLCEEVCMWKRLDHPNILRFRGVSLGKPYPLCMISDYMPKGSLDNYLKSNPSQDRLPIIKDVTEGLRYLHHLHIIHADLKAANVLVDSSDHCVLADFGLAEVTHDPATNPSFTKASNSQGSSRWMAPELLQDDEAQKSTFQSDIYAFAMTVLEICTCQVPFPTLRNERAIVEVLVHKHRPARPSNASDAVWEIMQRCWAELPKERPHMEVVAIMLDL